MIIKIIRKFILLFLLLISTQLLVSTELMAYTKIILPETPMENPPTNWAASDDASINVNIGFSFPFGSVGNITSIYINSNGALGASYWNTYSNASLPRGTPAYIIAPYWDDINRPQGGTIRYGTFGTAPNRHFVVAWKNTPRYPNTGDCTFQVVLYENGDIRFRYSTANVLCNGSSATVGIQESGAIYNQHSYNAVIDLSKDILYTNPAPQISLSKTLLTLSDPINSTSNPKAIPGALLEYTLKAINSGTGAADNNTIVLSDSVPTNTAIYVNDISGPGSGPIRFVDGSPASGLSYSFTSLASTTDDLSFSNNNGSTFNYTPSPDVDGVDSSVTDVKMKTQGAFAGASGGGNPNFEFKFRVIVQ